MKDKLIHIHHTRKPIVYVLGISLMSRIPKKKEFMNLSHSIRFVKEINYFFKVKFCYDNECETSQEATKRMVLMTKEEKEKWRKK